MGIRFFQNFARVKMQVTMSLSTLVGSTQVRLYTFSNTYGSSPLGLPLPWSMQTYWRHQLTSQNGLDAVSCYAVVIVTISTERCLRIKQSPVPISHMRHYLVLLEWEINVRIIPLIANSSPNGSSYNDLRIFPSFLSINHSEHVWVKALPVCHMVYYCRRWFVLHPYRSYHR